jgi:hypothetical protein
MADPDDRRDIESLQEQNDLFVSQITELKKRVEHLESIVLNLPEARLFELEERVGDLDGKKDPGEDDSGNDDADELDSDLNRALFTSRIGNLHY